MENLRCTLKSISLALLCLGVFAMPVMAANVCDPTTGSQCQGVKSTGEAEVTLESGGISAVPANGAAVSTTQPGVMVEGRHYKTARTLRTSLLGTLRTSDDTMLLYDTVEGAAVDINKWIQTTTTMTITQANGVVTFNAGNSVATTVGAMHTSHRYFAKMFRVPLVFRTQVRMTTHSNNNLIEFGFGAPSSATAAAVPNGAFFRKDGTGQIVPVVSVNSSETLGTPISGATFTACLGDTHYGVYEVVLEDTRAHFYAESHTGAMCLDQVVEFGATTTGFTATHLQSFHRTYNNAGTGSAVQLLVSGTSVLAIDSLAQKPYSDVLAGMSYSGMTVPTTYAQAANYANSAAPTSATLSNTAAGYTTLGGQWQFANVAGAETDYALFGFTNPAPYNLHIKGISICSVNMGAASATTGDVLQWGVAINSSAVSLATGAPYPAMRQAIGIQTAPTGTAIGAGFSPGCIQQTWEVPLVVFPGRFFHIVLKHPVGTATASQIIRGTAIVDAYFE